MSETTCTSVTACALGMLLFAFPAPAAGIPEPGLTLYGVVKNDLGGASVRLTTGTLTWTIAPSLGPPVTMTAELKNINDQFCYALAVPLESGFQGQQPSTNALQVYVSPTQYDFSQVRIGTNTAAIAPSATPVLELAQGSRGGYERMDLQVAVSYPDMDGDGLPDFWEEAHFWPGGTTPGADPDQDGMDNKSEYLAGTGPNDPGSAFEFIETEELPGGGFVVRWSSMEGRYYRISRSEDLSAGFVPLATGISATPPMNVHTDDTAATDQRFYRIDIE